MSITVVGSFVVDCIARCDRAPVAGETVIGNSFKTYLGGKGANQAFAAIRMGSKTTMVGAVGNDNFGNEFIECMDKEGFDTSYVKRSNLSTGTSLVTVEESGQNRIVMTPGANLDYSKEELRKNIESLVKSSDYCITQFEMKMEIAQELKDMCVENGKKLVLNPAPAVPVEDRLLDGLYLITPNETELGIIAGIKAENMDDYIRGAKILLSKGVKNVIVTLGTKGSLLVNENGEQLFNAYHVKAVDTVGAGDSFTGSLTSQLDQGKTIEEAIKIATAVAALEVQKNGAIPAMPYKEDVLRFIEENK